MWRAAKESWKCITRVKSWDSMAQFPPQTQHCQSDVLEYRFCPMSTASHRHRTHFACCKEVHHCGLRRTPWGTLAARVIMTDVCDRKIDNRLFNEWLLRQQCQQIGLNPSDDARSITKLSHWTLIALRSIGSCGPRPPNDHPTRYRSIIIRSTFHSEIYMPPSITPSPSPRHFRFPSVGVQCGLLRHLWRHTPAAVIWWDLVDSCDRLAHNFVHFVASIHRPIHIYILDTVPTIHVVWNYVATDKLPLQMAERLLRAQTVSVIGWARSERSAICSGKLCGGFNIFGQCCPCGLRQTCALIYSILL